MNMDASQKQNNMGQQQNPISRSLAELAEEEGIRLQATPQATKDPAKNQAFRM
mgnify:FL=1